MRRFITLGGVLALISLLAAFLWVWAWAVLKEFHILTGVCT